MNKKILFLLPTFLILSGNLSFAEAARPNDAPLCDLPNTLREIWADEAAWTRNLLISSAANLPDRSAVLDRLNKAPAQLGNALKTFYGSATADAVTAAFAQHIKIQEEVLTALRSQDNNKATETLARWHANADDFAKLLNSVNSANFELDHFREMFSDYLETTTKEFIAHLDQNWTRSITIYDTIHFQALHFGEHISSGIIKQFPERFHDCNASSGEGHHHGMSF